jgi:tetratricopeptide (TPR) repeat protein
LAELLFEIGPISAAAAVLDEALETARLVGNDRIEATAATWRAMVAIQRNEGTTTHDAISTATSAVGVLEGPEGGADLAGVLEILGRFQLFVGRAAEAATALDRGVGTAMRVGDSHRALSCLLWKAVAMAHGPATVSEVLGTAATTPESLSAPFQRDPAVVGVFASMLASSGRFGEARELWSQAQRHVSEIGSHLRAYLLFMSGGTIECLAGDLSAAESLLRVGYDGLGALGEAGYRSTVGAMFADVLIRLGRFDEAWDILEAVETLATPDDSDSQTRLRFGKARILASRGDRAKAEHLARDAVTMASRTDYLVLQGEALLALADVLDAGGTSDGARAARDAALELFERKQNTVLAGQTRERLAG